MFVFTSLLLLTAVFWYPVPSQDAHDLWVQHCWPHGKRDPADLLQHQAADRAGEGVPLQQVPDAGETGGSSQRPAAQRDAGESLVSEQTNEAEEITERRAARIRGNALTRTLSGHLPLS